MGYLYGARYVYEHAASDSTVQALRMELYCESYDSIDWIKTRHYIAPMDNYSSIPLVMKVAQNALARYETWSIVQPFKNWVRQRGLRFSIDYLKAEDLQTNYIDIGPVNKVLNMLCAYDDAGRQAAAPSVQQHLARLADYLWIAEDGMKMKGYNGSQCWDTSFAIQAISETGLLDEFPAVAQGVWSYLERTQILSTEVSQATLAYEYELPENRRKFYRHLSEGGWPFSTSAHGWPISDCTGEGLKGVLCLRQTKTILDGLVNGSVKSIGEQRLQKSVDVLLSYQNEDGGFATYENTRGFGWYESLNPSEVFGDIMIDYSYVECTMASLTGLVEFAHEFPDYRRDEIRHAVAKGRDFLKSLQRKDGSWYGSWACCFCYGTWFGVEGLVKCGEPLDSPSIVSACRFLLNHQRPNGGWGEDFTSCYDKAYSREGMQAYGHDGSGVVPTGWALLALAEAKCPDLKAIQRGVEFLLKRQLPCGDWPQEGIAGVFNRACGITYTAYRNVFPIWALARCRTVYGAKLVNGKTL
jgi:squalene/oxidosqualene cyclase-like protein